MFEFWKKYLLSTVAMRAPPDDIPAGDPDGGDDRIPEPEIDDDEGVQDPEGEPEEVEDDAEQDGDSGDGPEQQQPVARQTRGDRTVGELRRLARERADENARLTREMAEMRGRLDQIRRQPAAAVETAQQRAERHALMSPEERAMELVNESLQRHERNQQQLTNQLLDQSDRAAFEAKAASNPLLKKLAPHVERRRQEILQRDGNLIPRDYIATYLIGERVLAQQGTGKKGAAERRRAQQVRPTGGRSDVANPRRDRGRTGDTVADFENKFGDTPI